MSQIQCPPFCSLPDIVSAELGYRNEPCQCGGHSLRWSSPTARWWRVVYDGCLLLNSSMSLHCFVTKRAG